MLGIDHLNAFDPANASGMLQVAGVTPRDVEMRGRLGVWEDAGGAWGAAQLHADVRHVTLHETLLSDAQLQAAFEAHADTEEPVCSSLLPYGALSDGLVCMRAICSEACMRSGMPRAHWNAAHRRAVTLFPEAAVEVSHAAVSRCLRPCRRPCIRDNIGAN